MNQEQKLKVEEIIGQLQCPYNFKCYKMGLKDLCKARDIGLESHLECLEERPYKCKFSVAFGHSYFCYCPLRVYIAKELKR
ncbi:MAG: hypothetical protein PVJ62_00450 [Deltaproteobacteria bacterium]